ncbi:hypothetical protein GMAR_ORF285 [Golden Marseillevirus]|uniref:hypothetical protein n=1 Tax=Golden Marseillevirus TaxID=1720526 RepID=UPI000877AE4E|nr:hypothetical protein GMAR_ORF285 [Golden Marseillevirus]ALX27659.1 hypothetical protein GMAR_ORF285 [Golden Marseillevirus]
MSVHDVMPEILASLVFPNVRRSSFLVCRFVCKRWKEALKKTHKKIWSRKNIRSRRRRFGTSAFAPSGKSVICWALSQGAPWDKDTPLQIARSGDVESFEWLRRNKYPRHREFLEIAAKNGHLSLLKYIKKKAPCFWDGFDVLRESARHGHLHVLLWLERKEKGMAKNYAVAYAARGGHLEILKWLKEMDAEGDDELLLDNAVRSGSMEVLDYVWKNWPQLETWASSAVPAAAWNNRVDMMEYLVSRGVPIRRHTLLYAVYKQNIEAIDWLIKNIPNFRWELVGRSRSRYGYHERGVMYYFTRKPDFNKLAWLRDHGCPWQNISYEWEEGKGNLELSKWLKENGCPLLRR